MTVIVVENGPGDPKSNPRRTCMHFLLQRYLCLDIAQRSMNGAPNETWTHLWRFASASLLSIAPPEAPSTDIFEKVIDPIVLPPAMSKFTTCHILLVWRAWIKTYIIEKKADTLKHLIKMFKLWGVRNTLHYHYSQAHSESEYNRLI